MHPLFVAIGVPAGAQYAAALIWSAPHGSGIWWALIVPVAAVWFLWNLAMLIPLALGLIGSRLTSRPAKPVNPLHYSWCLPVIAALPLLLLGRIDLALWVTFVGHSLNVLVAMALPQSRREREAAAVHAGGPVPRPPASAEQRALIALTEAAVPFAACSGNWCAVAALLVLRAAEALPARQSLVALASAKPGPCEYVRRAREACADGGG